MIVESSDIRNGFIKPQYTKIYYQIDKQTKIHDDKKSMMFPAIYEVQDSDHSFDCEVGDELDDSLLHFGPEVDHMKRD